MSNNIKNVQKFQNLSASLYMGEYTKNVANSFIETRAQAKKNCLPIYKTPNLSTLTTLTFDEDTLWTDNQLPQKLLNDAKTPPLGVNELHKVNINGQGVNVAIIDQPLSLNHPEYKNQITSYKYFAPKESDKFISSLHGPAVTSLLCGKNLGVAPHAKIYYYAMQPGLLDSKYYAQALEDIIKTNETLKDKDKIKFVSVSCSLSGEDSHFENQSIWDKVYKHAKEKGICVIDCSKKTGFVGLGYQEIGDKNSFKYGFPNNNFQELNKPVYAPGSKRTIATSYDDKHFSYTYDGIGGLSWSIPYVTGLLCLGQQQNPNLSAENLKEILINSSKNNNFVINPMVFIRQVKVTTQEKEQEQK